MIAVTRGASFHTAWIRAVPMFSQPETSDAFARNQPRQPARVLFGSAKGMNRVDGKRALHRRLRAQARIGPLELLHDQAVSCVAQSGTAVLFQVRSKESQRAHPRP